MQVGTEANQEQMLERTDDLWSSSSGRILRLDAEPETKVKLSPISQKTVAGQEASCLGSEAASHPWSSLSF
jgi:hypothetical protein